MEKKDLMRLTDEQLIQEKKRLQKSKIQHALLIGFLVGIVTVGLVSWFISSKKSIGFLLPFVFPMVFIYRLWNSPQKNKELEEVLRERGLA
ncbi:MAG: hypothetical protein ACK4LB_10950 [Spirosomataceae bacterium]